MAKAKIEGAEEVLKTNTAIYFKATRELTLAEHQQLSEKIRYEKAKSKKAIVLVPYSVEVEEGPSDEVTGEADAE